MIKPGKKTKRWNQIRNELKKEFYKKGITNCELEFLGCWRSNGLSFAHLDKHRHLSDGDLYDVVLACIHCHQKVEVWPRQQMREYLTEIISKRI